MKPQSMWLVWSAVALVAGIVEITTVHLVFIMFAGGAVAAAVTALLGLHPIGQVITFTGVSAALLGLVRPSALRRWRRGTPETATGVAALVGRPAEVVAEVTGRGGRVKLAGEVWSARYEGDGGLPAGLTVQVLAIEGATVVVAPAPGAMPPFGVPAQERPQPLAQDPHHPKDPSEGAETP
jgi:membrane protein implicated in regulation of membrane protease activity